MIVSKSMEITLSVIAYSICSGTLVLLNKLVLHYSGGTSFPSIIVSFQLSVTLLFIAICKYTKTLTVDDIQWIYVKPYLVYTIAFSLGVYCNMKSLSYSNVETVIVFRAMSPCVVAILDYLFLGREMPRYKSWLALFIIVAGAFGYAHHDPQFSTQGIHTYSWPFLYMLIISFEMAYGKRIIGSVDLKTLSGPVLYTNMLGIWPFFLFAYMGNEYQSFYNVIIIDQKYPSTYAILLLGMSCIAGTGIGYASWWCRDQVSATTFTLIGVMNKCLTVLINLFIWDQHASISGILSLFVCLLGGMLYEQAPMRNNVTNTTITAKEYIAKQTTLSDDVWNDHDATELPSNMSDDDHDEHEALLAITKATSGDGLMTKRSSKQQ